MDGVTIEQLEADIGNQLYILWNRLSSGSYFPAPVKRVEIPKADGSLRPLGIPTVVDRVAQMVVKRELEPVLEAIFHTDSYGYRPQRSAIDAVRQARQRCWRYDWVLDLDIQGFFDTLNHGLLLKALDKHNVHRWVRLYVQRWLTAPVEYADGRQERRGSGTPQGGVISPLLANLYLHYALDAWMDRVHSDIPFERYADDVVYHCRSRWQAERLLSSTQQRLTDCGLRAHPDKTRIVYCKDSNRQGQHSHISFDFLGYRFRPRGARNPKGQRFTAFGPSMSVKAFKRIKQSLRDRRVTHWVGMTPEMLAAALNPSISAWLAYYGHFGRADGVYRLRHYLDEMLMRWASNKYKRLKHRQRKSREFIWCLKKQSPHLFVHWTMRRG